VGGGTLTLPKYRPVNISISFPQPVMFTPGETKEIPYTVTGNVKFVRAFDITDEWTITVDETNKKIIVTADERINQRQAAGVATLLISDDDAHVIMRSLTVAVPTHPDGVLINGVIWAKYNVAEPGVFAASPADNGMLYQFNRRVGWSASDPLTSCPPGEEWKVPTTVSTTWEAVNDPCPEGWHVPNLDVDDDCKERSVWLWVEGVEIEIDGVKCMAYGRTSLANNDTTDRLCMRIDLVSRPTPCFTVNRPNFTLHTTMTSHQWLNIAGTCVGTPICLQWTNIVDATGVRMDRVAPVRCVHD
jgi:hypothetical protein